ncbi:hypothetical protein SLE2022_396000 [Rubroshorea leprosula]
MVHHKRSSLPPKDHFQKLPESLILIIISFLPFKEAVRTSVLSKHWCNFWRSTGNVELNEGFFVDPEDSVENQREQRRNFLDFAQKWIREFQEPCIRNFALVFSRRIDIAKYMQGWVKFALDHHTKGLTLDLSDPTWDDEDLLKKQKPIFHLPSQAYKYKGFESLNLVLCKVNVSALVNLGMLKDLSLAWMELSGSHINTLLKNCPLLESLSVKRCWGFEQIDISFVKLRLEKLVIDKCLFNNGTCWISIEGPELRYFNYSGPVGLFYLENQSGLDEAYLDFGMVTEFEPLDSEIYIYTFLEQIQFANVLSVCSYLIQLIPYGNFAPFALCANHLILKTSLHAREFLGIKFLLDSCILLETLTIEIYPTKIFTDVERPYVNWARDFFEKLFLKVVEVKGFKGTDDELYTLQFILRIGKAIEQVNIYICREVDDDGGINMEHYAERAQLVHELSKASKNVRISIY